VGGNSCGPSGSAPAGSSFTLKSGYCGGTHRTTPERSDALSLFHNQPVHDSADEYLERSSLAPVPVITGRRPFVSAAANSIMRNSQCGHRVLANSQYAPPSDPGSLPPVRARRTGPKSHR
jgi:hypothetical protein